MTFVCLCHSTPKHVLLATLDTSLGSLSQDSPFHPTKLSGSFLCCFYFSGRFPVAFFPLWFNRSFSKGKSLSMEFFSWIDLWYVPSASLSTRSFMITRCVQCFGPFFLHQVPFYPLKGWHHRVFCDEGFHKMQKSNCAWFSFTSFLAWLPWFSTPLLSQYVGTSWYCTYTYPMAALAMSWAAMAPSISDL